MRLQLVLPALILFGTACLAQQPWQPDEFPIGYWYGPPPEFNTAATWQTVADAGFTFGGMRAYGREGNLQMLDYCRQAGIKAIVQDVRTMLGALESDSWQEIIQDVVADYGGHPALYGYYLQDEPNSVLFPDLGRLSGELQRQDPAHLPYINLFPTYASQKQLGNPTYAEHLEQFLTTVKPAVLSYDHYCLLADGTTRAGWYENLALVREAGLRHNTPPWVIILSLPHLGYRDPTASEMRWQVYTSLAYGMKGLMYFTYWTDPSWEADGQLAIIDSKGQPTRLYPIVRRLNAELRVLGRTLLGLTFTGVFHTGDIPPGATRLGPDAELAVPHDESLVIGCFKDAAGVSYAMVTNANLAKPVAATLAFRPHISGVRAFDATNGYARPQPLTDHELVLDLQPGEGRLLRLVSNFRYPKPVAALAEIDFGFDQDGDLEWWEGFASLADPTVAGGVLSMTFTGRDPSLARSRLRLRPDQYTTIAVRMKLPPCNPEGQLFWTTSASPGFADTMYLNFPVIPDGQWHEYRIPVATHPLWRGHSIRALRLDPTTGGATEGSKVEIDWIRGE